MGLRSYSAGIWGGGLKSQESCGNRIDRLRESGAVEVDCIMSLQSDSHVLATIE